jgi:preprotein translocase subunit SecA
MLRWQIDKALQRFLDPDYGPASFASFATNRLGIDFQASEFRSGYEDAVKYAQDKAANTVPTIIQELLEENLNPDEDPKDWRWSELCRALQARFGLAYTERELKKIPRERLDEFLIAKAEEKLLAVDLQDGQRYLSRSYGAESLAEWMRQKFDIRVDPTVLLEMEVDQLRQFLYGKIREAYRKKDIEFPVLTAMRHYLPEKVSGGHLPDREKLYHWAVQRLGTALVTLRNPQAFADPNGFFHAAYQILGEFGLTEEFVRTESRSRIREKLLEIAAQSIPAVDIEEIEARLHEVFSGARQAEEEDARELVDWCKQVLHLELEVETFVGRSQEEALHRILNAYDKKYRPEMRSVERGLILEQLDNAWKSHLLVMDSLRSGVGLRGYAQEDPKIVYKREGMKEFEAMWEGVRERITESVFRMEEMGDDAALSALWAGARATHEVALSALQARQAQEQQAAVQTNTGSEKRIEPIRNVGRKVGRNDPCPCGSGKKYKNCHMRLETGKR